MAQALCYTLAGILISSGEIKSDDKTGGEIDRFQLSEGMKGEIVILEVTTAEGKHFNRIFTKPFAELKPLISFLVEKGALNKGSWRQDLPLEIQGNRTAIFGASVDIKSKGNKIDKLAVNGLYLIGWPDKPSRGISAVQVLGCIFGLIGLFFTGLMILMLWELAVHYKKTGSIKKFEFPNRIGDSIEGWRYIFGGFKKKK